MLYSIKPEELNNNSLEFMIDWCISLYNYDYKQNKVVRILAILLDEKLKRNEIS